MTILIAEDEEDICQMLTDLLSEEGYKVLSAHDGVEALELFQKEKIDLGLFDSMMPRMDGVTLMKKIRETSQMPIIFLTAKGQELDKVNALTMGADDYIVKPFSVAELKARILVQMRRLSSNENEKRMLVCGEIEIDCEAAVAYLRKKPIRLSAKEYQLLIFFMQNQDKLLTKKQLYHAVWQEEYIYDDNTIMVHISKLRNKLEKDPKKPEYLVTYKGLGYKLTSKV